MKRTPKSTIYDIAQKANASPSTVSAALNGTWKTRRIRAETAQRIIKIAQDFGYSTNLQARGLRTAKSGLTALLMPDYNRFFSSLAEAFSSKVRQMGLCPVIVSTDRDHDEELSTVAKLASYAIDSLFIAGASCPEEISQYCQKAQIDHIFIDQPCALAASVTTDNVWGARQLTSEILASRIPSGDPMRDEPYFNRRRTAIFLLRLGALRASGRNCRASWAGSHDHQIIASSYDADYAEQAIRSLYGKIGGLPSALFVNSISSFEGILRFLLGPSGGRGSGLFDGMLRL